MTDHEPVTDTSTEPVVEATPPPADVPSDVVAPEPAIEPKPVDAVRSAAGRAGAKRVQELARLGREYEREHGLKPGRQRRRQLIQLGRRYELEHGLAAPKLRKRKRGDAWTEFLAALARVVKPVHRPAVEQLVAALRQPKVVPPPAAA
ncbi:MAG: hypothetical protein J0I06_01625 [Planctomycetes bacterium]|nr:hypothetical protein [Planctomycetota bacterium]